MASYTFTFTSNPGNLFKITGNQILVNISTITAGNYPVTVRATDNAGIFIDRNLVLVAGAGSSFTTVPRNVFQQPYGINSIWNTPLGVGTGAFISGGTGSHGGATFRYTNNDGPLYEKAPGMSITYINKDDSIFLFGPSSPTRTLFTNTADWSGNSRCNATQTSSGTTVPVPANAIYVDDFTNAGGVILLANRQTLHQSQPLQVCSVGGTITSHYIFTPHASIFADESSSPPSARGAHGGSAMSCLGGTIRFNEIIPGNCPFLPGVADVMRHTLGVSFNGNVFNAFTGAGGHVWPATNGDAGNEGLLLALLPSFNVNSLTTVPARSIAWTLMNYGGYTVDNAAGTIINLPTEISFGDTSVNCPTGNSMAQWQSVWGFNPIGTVSNAFQNDMVTICQALYVITNNTPSSIGGLSVGGRKQPLAATPVDPGNVTSAPVVADSIWSMSTVGLGAGQLVAQSTATNSPYWWTVTGTGSTNFWIQPTTGLIYVSVAGVSGIVAGTYTLTTTAQNIVGTDTGTVTIVVS